MVAEPLSELFERTELNAPHWAALEEGRLLFQRCSACGNAWLPPRSECPRCLAPDWSWEEASGQGRLVSWVRYHVAFHPAFEDRLPYTVAVVELAEGPRLITNLVESGGPAPTADAPVMLEIQADGGIALARFRPV